MIKLKNKSRRKKKRSNKKRYTKKKGGMYNNKILTLSNPDEIKLLKDSNSSSNYDSFIQVNDDCEIITFKKDNIEYIKINDYIGKGNYGVISLWKERKINSQKNNRFIAIKKINDRRSFIHDKIFSEIISQINWNGNDPFVKHYVVKEEDCSYIIMDKKEGHIDSELLFRIEKDHQMHMDKNNHDDVVSQGNINTSNIIDDIIDKSILLIEQGIYYYDLKFKNILYDYNSDKKIKLYLGDIGSLLFDHAHQSRFKHDIFKDETSLTYSIDVVNEYMLETTQPEKKLYFSYFRNNSKMITIYNTDPNKLDFINNMYETYDIFVLKNFYHEYIVLFIEIINSYMIDPVSITNRFPSDFRINENHKTYKEVEKKLLHDFVSYYIKDINNVNSLMERLKKQNITSIQDLNEDIIQDALNNYTENTESELDLRNEIDIRSELSLPNEISEKDFEQKQMKDYLDLKLKDIQNMSTEIKSQIREAAESEFPTKYSLREISLQWFEYNNIFNINSSNYREIKIQARTLCDYIKDGIKTQDMTPTDLKNNFVELYGRCQYLDYSYPYSMFERSNKFDLFFDQFEGDTENLKQILKKFWSYEQSSFVSDMNQSTNIQPDTKTRKKKRRQSRGRKALRQYPNSARDLNVLTRAVVIKNLKKIKEITVPYIEQVKEKLKKIIQEQEPEQEPESAHTPKSSSHILSADKYTVWN